jgi:hypothetical protein
MRIAMVKRAVAKKITARFFACISVVYYTCNSYIADIYEMY